MAASRQRKKSKLTKNDRVQLCDLPDDILIRILSLLPTRDSVATSILSRKWKYLWKSITTLDFREYNYVWYRSRMSKFMNFVDRVMILHDRSSLASFSLSCKVSTNAACINTWITSAIIGCNIKDLSLQLYNCAPSYRLPLRVFRCESLVKLELKVECVLRVPSSIRLPNVKYLKLYYVKFDNDESAEKLLSLPSLEELYIRGSLCGAIRSLSVTFPKLRVFKLHDDGWFKSKWANDIDCKIRFSGDSLEYFRFTGFPSSDYYICGSAMQLKAELLVEYWNHNQVNLEITAKRCYKLLSGLSRVLNLTLTKDFLQILEKTPKLVDTLPVFECVVQLNLKAYITNVHIDSLMIMEIYERCPHLEHLNFMRVLSNCGRDPILQPMPSCFRTHLKRITIADYEPEEQGNALQALLNSAPILEEMIVVPSTVCLKHLESEFQIQKFEDEINDRPRASKDCRISVAR